MNKLTKLISVGLVLLGTSSASAVTYIANGTGLSNPIGNPIAENVSATTSTGSVFADGVAGYYSGENDFAGTALGYLNDDDLFGTQTWSLLGKSDTANDPVTDISGVKDGAWGLSGSYTGDIVVSIKAGNGYSMYFFDDVSQVSGGFFNTSGTLNNGGNQPNLSHLTVFTAAGGLNPGTVPEPSTYAMFGAAFLILGITGYRSRSRKS